MNPRVSSHSDKVGQMPAFEMGQSGLLPLGLFLLAHSGEQVWPARQRHTAEDTRPAFDASHLGSGRSVSTYSYTSPVGVAQASMLRAGAWVLAPTPRIPVPSLFHHITSHHITSHHHITRHRGYDICKLNKTYTRGSITIIYLYIVLLEVILHT